MQTRFFLLLASAVFLYTQNGQAVMTSEGHRLSEQQKHWVHKNRPESNVKKCNSPYNCTTEIPNLNRRLIQGSHT